MEPERWLLVSDVDDTLLGDDSALANLASTLQSSPQPLTIAYNSSRPCASLRKSLTATLLPMPDYLIGALGTEIQAGPSGEWLTDYPQHLMHNWNRERITELLDQFGFILHAPEYQTPLKVSCSVPDPDAYHQVLNRLDAAEIKAKVIFSGGHNLDIIPAYGGKGSAIKYLSQSLQISDNRIVVAGDSGNDVDMFLPIFKGIIVGNADNSLKQLHGDHLYHAQATHANGVLEGLHYWGVLS